MSLGIFQVPGQANRRKLRVFLATLAVALIITLGFTWLRAPEYRASARLEITPSTAATVSWVMQPEYRASTQSEKTRAAATGTLPRQSVSEPGSASSFLTEVQVLTSRRVLELVAANLRRSGYDLSALGPDPVAGIQSRMEAIPVPATNVVELVATAERSDLLAPLINTTISVYQDMLAKAYNESSGDSKARADDEVAKLERIVAAKRRDVEAFRLRNNIVSLERDENEVLARVRNLSTSLRLANEKAAAAEGKLGSLTESTATGQVVARSKDNPTLANLEQRASKIREELQTLERSFTPEYMAKDPQIVAERTRLAELERQIAAERAASHQTEVIEAKQELASAQGASARIQSEMSQGRQEAAQFTARFNEYKSRQDELAELETAYRDAVQRRAKLEASELERMPATKVLETATTPREPWRPLYWRDSALSLGGSLVIALIAMWLVELFNRPDPQPAVVLIQPSSAMPLRALAPNELTANPPLTTLEAAEPALLPSQPRLPRELRNDEITALLQSSGGNLLAPLLLLSGLTVEEALRLRWSDIDQTNSRVHVGDQSGRDIVIGAAVSRALADRANARASECVLDEGGRPATRDSVEANILCAALDAGIEEATQVTSDTLWHTYVAYLVRQGIRFSDLTRLVGSISPETLRQYSVLSPPGSRTPTENIASVLPPLR